VKYGQGASRVSDIPRLCVITGMRLSSGSVAAGVAKQIFSVEDAIDFWGEGSEIARMAEAALEVGGVNLWGIATTEPSGGAVATGHFVVGGSWSEAGSIALHVGGHIKEIAVTASNTVTQVGDAIVTGLQELPNLFCTAA